MKNLYPILLSVSLSLLSFFKLESQNCTGNLLSNPSFENGNFDPNVDFPFAGGDAIDFGDETPTGYSQSTNNGDNYWVQSSAAHSDDKYVYMFSAGTTPGGNDACTQFGEISVSGGQCYKLYVYAADAKADGFGSGLSLEVQENNGGPFHYDNLLLPDNPVWDDNALTTIPWALYCYEFTPDPGTDGVTFWVSASAEQGGATSYVVVDDLCVVTCPPPACAISVVSATPSACNPLDNHYSLQIEISYQNSPGGDITVQTEQGANLTFTPDGTSPDVVTLVGLTADEASAIDVTAFFVNETTCTHTLVSAYNAPASCSPPPCSSPNCGTVTITKN